MRYISEDDKETKKKGTRRRKRNRKILLVGLEKRLVKLSQKQKQELIDVNEHDFEGYLNYCYKSKELTFYA